MADFDDEDLDQTMQEQNDTADNNAIDKDATTAKQQKKGRGHHQSQQIQVATKTGNFDSLNTIDANASNSKVQKSVEGYALFVTGVHEEAKDDDIYDKFSEFGHVKQFDVPLDRKTGFVKGYALVEFATYKEAQSAIDGVDQTELYGKLLSVDWAFYKAS
mmetsp:Transcript_48640/g.80672  ORF Transcript_48640/g.80672 Transcript_48640/m.80672 type:complete len:160 (-) Transcript_48640:761-1240(-)